MKFAKGSNTRRRLTSAIAVAGLGLALSGCVVYPSGYGGYGYGRAYYAAPVYYAPPPVVVGFGGGWGWGGGWGRGGGGWRGGGGRGGWR